MMKHHSQVANFAKSVDEAHIDEAYMVLVWVELWMRLIWTRAMLRRSSLLFERRLSISSKKKNSNCLLF